MVRGRLEQVDPGVAGVRGGYAAGRDVGERRAALQRVVDHLTDSRHEASLATVTGVRPLLRRGPGAPEARSTVT
ncbi:hypothetical protein GCM10023203_18200 [Actinomycetospora straminea]|uniref:Uncharacterized protein n=1 Tax=Actinomycetospora straminea TaxID=663607 RepID=A0ABP9E8R0_9PSEU